MKLGRPGAAARVWREDRPGWPRQPPLLMVTVPPSCGKTSGTGDGSSSHELNPLQLMVMLPAGTPALFTTGTFTMVQQNCVIVPLTVKPVPVLVKVKQLVTEAQAPSKTGAEVVGGGNWAWH
jgi:hypothetical protein